MVIGEHLRRIAAVIGMRDAQLLYISALETDALDLFMRAADEADKETMLCVDRMAERLKNGEPLQYIVGEQEFMGFKFRVDPSVLIPRSDTETLVEYIIGHAQKGARILDIGTGSGCIGISLAKLVPDASVTCTDKSAAAIDKACENADINGAEIKTAVSDIMEEVPEGEYDIIVSNPPYIRTNVIETLEKNVKDHEPHTALDGGEDGLIFYRRITDIAPLLLCRGGMLCYEIGYDQGADVAGIMSARFDNVEIIKDLCGNDRVVSGILR